MLSDTMSKANDTKIPTPMAAIEQNVSKLLMTTKRLLETLTAWSSGTATDTQVYDEYNALEIHFAGATQAFESVLLPMEDMLHLPDDLYNCLKTTLSKEPSSATLEKHLPAIRDTIIQLLQGLKRKQSMLRERFEPNVNSKLLSRAHLSPLRTSDTTNAGSMPLPSPSSSTEPIRIDSPNSSKEEFDMTDPSTQDAVNALSRQENLARRSSVRKQTISVYLKKGEKVKKALLNVNGGITLKKLQGLFCTSFCLDEKEAFEIYILDQASNIEYELEDMNDVKAYCILSMKGSDTINPELTLELKSLFQDTMQQLLSKINNKIPKEKESELDSVRCELAQLQKEYNDYKIETNTLIQELKEKNPPPALHADMDEGRKVTQKAATLITNRLEALQDTIDQLKLDVTQRRCRPSRNQLKNCTEESNRLQDEIDALQSRIKKFKPLWKKTWETELQQIVKEQQFLKEQEALVVDLQDDHKSVLEVLEQLQKISEIHERKKQLGIVDFVRPSPPPEEEGFDSVMKQVENIHVDHSRRVEALAQAEKQRSKELSQRIDAFERELTDFVELRKLKKIGGPQAIEKQRQEKNEALIRQIFVSQQAEDHDLKSDRSNSNNLDASIEVTQSE